MPGRRGWPDRSRTLRSPELGSSPACRALIAASQSVAAAPVPWWMKRAKSSRPSQVPWVALLAPAGPAVLLYLAPPSVAPIWLHLQWRRGRSSPLIWPRPGIRRGIAGSEAGGRVAAGWFACGRVGRDVVERLASGAAEMAGDLAESVDEGGQGVGAGGFAQVVLGRGGDLGLGAVEVEVVQDGVDVDEQEDQVAGVSGVQVDAGDVVVAAGLGEQGHGSPSLVAGARAG